MSDSQKRNVLNQCRQTEFFLKFSEGVLVLGSVQREWIYHQEMLARVRQQLARTDRKRGLLDSIGCSRSDTTYCMLSGASLGMMVCRAGTLRYIKENLTLWQFLVITYVPDHMLDKETETSCSVSSGTWD